MITETEYFQTRLSLVNKPETILLVEEKFTAFLLDVVLEIAEDISIDFSKNAQALLPFWRNYPPEQRGRQPTGAAIPLLELGEKTISSHLIRKLTKRLPKMGFAGVPTGGDVRFSTEDTFVHFDIKLTGPNDNPNELVVPPNQISGDGRGWKNHGMTNSSWPIYYQAGKNKGQVNYNFQPKLPPFYVLEGKVLVCLTFFLKATYNVLGFGIQPLDYFELVCVPNGLLMFDNDAYGKTEGLMIAGKDDKTKAHDSRRVRIRLEPLSKIQPWRSIKLLRKSAGWRSYYRVDETTYST